MKQWFVLIFLAFVTGATAVAEETTIMLPKPNLSRGDAVMKAFEKRSSQTDFSDRALSLDDLSDLLYAANGVNRANGKRTAASAMNRQEITVYVFFKDGAYRYDYARHALTRVAEGDYRKLFQRQSPAVILLTADMSKQKNERMAGVDAGIVAQNISIFCAGTDMITRIHASMDAKELSKALQLNAKEIPYLNLPVGYKK